MSQIIIRDFNPERDTGIILSTWPKGFYCKGIDIGIEHRVEGEFDRHWFREYYEYVKERLEYGKVKIACIKDSPDTIIGYAVINGSTLEWIYVKYMFRKQGIAKLLISGEYIDSYNNMTKLGYIIFDKVIRAKTAIGETENDRSNPNDTREEIKQELQGL